MRRRQFIALFGGVAAVWPVAARAQQNERMRRIGVLMGYAESDPEAKGFLAGFTQKLGELGWIDGRNLRMDVRWAPGSVDRMRTFAKELVELQPDVILANSTPITAELQRETRTIPIVFAVASDPVGSGFVVSLARPGGNITGFSIAEPSLPGKWLELLTEIVPKLQRAAIMFNPDTASYVSLYYSPSFEAAAQSRNVTPITARVRSDAEIDVFRRAAPYVDRVLHGTMPSELPVQMPIKYILAINAKTAKALGLAVPSTLLATADEVIE